jgi:hypothetical protein
LASSTTHVRGLQASLKELRKIDPKLATAARKRLRDDAKPLVQEAKRMVPDVPLSRWRALGSHQRDTVGQKTLRTSGRFPVFEANAARRRIALSITNKSVKGFKGRRRLIAMVEKDAAGELADMNQGNAMARNQAAKYGKASRFMWPAAEKHLDTVRVSIRKSVREIERDVNMRLRMRSI